MAQQPLLYLIQAVCFDLSNWSLDPFVAKPLYRLKYDLPLIFLPPFALSFGLAVRKRVDFWAGNVPWYQ